ncbi:DUF2306 domain-containing protein [Virgisporangium ochraceum]|uniref:Membrane protein n=1 Tax=Virgisporangium ochraceum TaxID=65505 RepID=A0A8J3ZMS6_9ACTN|nr:DUF2306 domain-containing protein [Virgisporangium ochraceum]GIJ67174.1 membrane protein [Virgisporangium ochraceum]
MTRRWLIPTGLLLLSAVPVAAGAFRVTQLSTGAAAGPGDERFAADPVPVVVHIVTVTVFCVLGAFQFLPRRGTGMARPAWHRVTGRILVPAGLGAALSGLWLTVFFPRPDDVGTLVTVFRLVFGTAMAVAVVLGAVAVRRRDFAGHRAWMVRGYAIGLGAGTQAFTHAVFIAATGPVDRTGKAFAMLAGWLINLAVAEVAIRGRAHRRTLMGAAR